MLILPVYFLITFVHCLLVTCAQDQAILTEEERLVVSLRNKQFVLLLKCLCALLPHFGMQRPLLLVEAAWLSGLWRSAFALAMTSTPNA